MATVPIPEPLEPGTGQGPASPDALTRFARRLARHGITGPAEPS